MQTSEIYIESSRKRRALIFYFFFAAGRIGIDLLRGRFPGDAIEFLICAAVGTLVVSAFLPRRYFRSTADSVEGPDSIGWQIVSIPKADLNDASLRRTHWDRMNGVMKVRTKSGKVIAISALDFTKGQRAQIGAQLRSLIEIPDIRSARLDVEPRK